MYLVLRCGPCRALLTTVNIYGFMELGKIIFAICDVLVGDLMQKIMLMSGVSEKVCVSWFSLISAYSVIQFAVLVVKMHVCFFP